MRSKRFETSQVINPFVKQLAHLSRFWIGQDLQAAEEINLEPQVSQRIRFWLDHRCLPPVGFHRNNISDLLSLLKISMRSRIAQLGMEIESSITFEGETNGNLIGSVEVKTLGNCPIAIHKGEAFACLYHPAGSVMLLGKALKEEIGGGLIIDGVKETEWNFFRIEHIGHKWHTHGVLLKIDPHITWRVGNCIDTFDILNPSVKDFRGSLESSGMLEKLTIVEKERFWVGETIATIHIKRGLNGILSNQVYDECGSQLGFIQTESNLIRGGETDWKLRTEFMVPNGSSPVLLDHAHIFIALVLYKDAYYDQK